MTHRHSFTKATAHIGILDLTGKHHKSAGQPAGSDHLLQCKCSIDFDQFEIFSAANKFRLLLRKVYLLNVTNNRLKKEQIIKIKFVDWDICSKNSTGKDMLLWKSWN